MLRTLPTALVAALLPACLLLPACSNLPTESSLTVLVEKDDLAAFVPFLRKNDADVEELSDGSWEIDNNARSRKAMEALLESLDRRIRTSRESLAMACVDGLTPRTGLADNPADGYLAQLTEARRHRSQVAGILELMDPARRQRELNPDGAAPAAEPERDNPWRPVAEFYDSRLPVASAHSADDLIEQAARRRFANVEGQPLTGSGVASR